MANIDSVAQRIKTAIPVIAQVLFFLCGAVTLITGTAYAIMANVPVAVACLAAGILLLFAATIERFESLKGWGIEATTRLDKKIVEADEAIARLRDLAEIAARALIRLDAGAGRLSGPPSASESYELAQRTLKILSTLNVERKIIDETLKPWVNIMCIDLARHLLTPLKARISNEQDALSKRLQAIPQPMQADNPELMSVTTLRRQLMGFDKSVSKITELVEGDFPHNLIGVLESAPDSLKSDATITIQQVKSFERDIRELRTTGTLVSPIAILTAVHAQRT